MSKHKHKSVGKLTQAEKKTIKEIENKINLHYFQFFVAVALACCCGSVEYEVLIILRHFWRVAMRLLVDVITVFVFLAFTRLFAMYATGIFFFNINKEIKNRLENKNG